MRRIAFVANATGVLMPPEPLLLTERLVLRCPRLTDFDHYAAYWEEPKVVQFITGAAVSREEAWSKMLRQVGLWQLLGFGFFVVEERSSGRFMGSVGFQDLRRDLRPSIEGTLETGWGLRPEYQGRGYASEALTAAMTWAREALPRLDYSCIIDPHNSASLKLATRLGFVEVARCLYHASLVIILKKRAALNGAN